MKRIGTLALLIGLVTANGWGLGQDTYTIKLKTPGKGDVARVTDTATATTEWKAYSPSEGDVEEGKASNGGTMVYTESIFETGADMRPIRLRRQYEKAEKTNGDKVEKLAFDGKAVLIEKKGERYRFQLEGGGELTGDAAKPLDDFNDRKPGSWENDRLLMPGKPVKLNETWTVNAVEFAKTLTFGGLVLDVAKASGTGKLVKAYKKDGRQFGVIEVQLELPLESFDVNGKKTVLEAGSLMTMSVSTDLCIDGSSYEQTLTDSIQLRAKLTVEYNKKYEKAKMIFKFDARSQETRKEVGKK